MPSSPSEHEPFTVTVTVGFELITQDGELHPQMLGVVLQRVAAEVFAGHMEGGIDVPSFNSAYCWEVQ